MNRKIGLYGSAINFISVLTFAISMLVGTNYIDYLSSTFISIGFLLMICAFAGYHDEKTNGAAYLAIGFAVSYITLIVIVYFTQMTTVYQEELTKQAAQILDYKRFGLMFTFDLLAYMMMAASTFFISFVVKVENKCDQWLKWLLRIHGIFAISCFVTPLLNIFNASESSQNSGVGLLEFWCSYFMPVAILSFLHFKNKRKPDGITA
ncbi:MAG: hypothetical protein PUC65_08170 [Clostridiales bacterium]|nr:hypothetical protein [Clostridiales bacterium]